MSNSPEDLKYTESHEWVRTNDDGTLTVGITDHAQELLGDLVFVEPPEAGSRVTAKDGCAVVESVKAASDVYAPVTGEVVAVNDELLDSPEQINEDPYGEGWIFRVAPETGNVVQGLMDATAYEQLVEASS